MPLLNEKVTAETRRILSEMREPVRMTCFTRAGCQACGPVAGLAAELAAIAPRLQVQCRDIVADQTEAVRLGVSRVPALALAREGEERVPVRYFGLPSGHEFGAFLRAILVLSTGRGMAGADAAAVAPITRPARLTVFVLANCPRCPEMVYLCASIAAASPLISADIVDAAGFPELAARFTVGVVPKVLVNETLEVIDVVPAGELIARVAAAAAAP